MSSHPSPSLDPASVREAVDYYDSWLGFRQRYLRIPGVQAAVYAEDKVVMTGAHGYADVDTHAVLSDQHLFRIASHTKTLTATAIFQLLEQGLLRLDDTAGQWVRELTQAAAPLASATIRQLLAHSAGVFRDSTDGDFWQLRRPFPDRAELLDIVCSAEAAVLPRNEQFKYSNIGFGLLGLIIEAATGRAYADVINENICKPLGLHDIGPEYIPARAQEYATGYSARSYSDRRVPIEHVDTRALAPATGAYATAADLVSYFSAHFFTDTRLLSDDSKRLMQHALWQPAGGDATKRYAAGLGVTEVGDRTMIGHGGGYPGHSTYSIADPHGRIAVSALTNAIDGPAEPLALAGVRLVDLACARTRPDDAGLERFCGRFASLWAVVDVALLGGRLYLVSPTQENPVSNVVALEPVGDASLRMVDAPGYASPGESIHYTFGADGRVRGIRGPSAMSMTPIDEFSLGTAVHTP